MDCVRIVWPSCRDDGGPVRSALDDAFRSRAVYCRDGSDWVHAQSLAILLFFRRDSERRDGNFPSTAHRSCDLVVPEASGHWNGSSSVVPGHWASSGSANNAAYNPITKETQAAFENYNLVSAGVVNKDNKLIGMITADDVVTVVQEEAEEDVLRLAGVGDEEITDGVLKKTKRRFSWLLLNLFTAIIASIVIGFFQEDIEKVVALAVLMPIVASMGGNAGMQTLAVTVRAIAKKEISSGNFLKIVTKEFVIGILNGVIFAIIAGVVVQFWFKQMDLSILIAVSMILNMICLLYTSPSPRDS